MKKKKIYDLSPEISEHLSVYPGDTAFYLKTNTEEIADQATCSTSSMTTTVHIGAHVDAPIHVLRKGKTIDQLDLDPFLGPCQVIRFDLPVGYAIQPKDLGEIEAPRILFSTNSFNPARFTKDYNGLSADLIESLHRKGINLVGIDTPSIDPYSSKGEYPAHQKACGYGMGILEGLLLDHVPEGIYELIALSLKISGSDGSPVRAILREF